MCLLKKLLVGICLLWTCTPFVQAQDSFVINGQVTGVKDGVAIFLFREDGKVGVTIAKDTIRNGAFLLKGMVKDKTDKLTLLAYDPEFPMMGLAIYATPGATIKVTGDDTYPMTWKVESDVPQQQLVNKFILASRDLWIEYQKNTVQMMKVSSEERKVIKAKNDSISYAIHKNDIALLREMPYSDIWMDKFHQLCNVLTYDKGFPYKAELVNLYKGLSKEQKQTDKGQEIKTFLFPPQTVQIGDIAPDANFYDLQGETHHLSEFSGKYILLDFWSSGCGPCILSIPEMTEVYSQYKDRIEIVSLSLDTKRRWTEASTKEHQIIWSNWNELKGMSGLYAKYGIKGIPFYVLISPQGKVLSMTMGYKKGMFKEWFSELFE